jgi:hypothetical protein
LGALVAACAFGGAATAIAAQEGQPFEVTRFSMQTTAATNLLGYEPREGTYAKIENVPYRFTQAGGHPWALTTRIDFATQKLSGGVQPSAPARDVKDVVVDLPPGLLGDPMAVPRCSLVFVITRNGEEHCPADTQVGTFVYRANGGKESLSPIVNVTPEAGQSAEFAFENTVPLDTPLATGRLVRTQQAYGFEVVSNEIPLLKIESIETTFWGVPGDPSHDPLRGLECNHAEPSLPWKCERGERGGGEHFGYAPVVPFLTMGTDCSAGPETARLRTDSWEEPVEVANGQIVKGKYQVATTPFPSASSGFTGCNLLQFDPTIEAAPSTLAADEPVELGVNLSVPLSETPASLATPQLRNSVLTLPEGMSISPGIVDGVQACNATGPEGIDIPTGRNARGEELQPGELGEGEELGLNGEPQLASGHCPGDSTVGTAEAFTPFLPEPVKGHVYLARPGCGGAGQRACTEQDALDGNLYRLYLELGGTGLLAKTGVHFKVPMETMANPATGQLTTRVLDTPQAPFNELKIHLNGGPRAPLDNPATCGRAVTTADFTPWSAPGETLAGLFTAGTPDAMPESFFDVQGCMSPTPFAPGFVAGTLTPQAGQFSAFTLDLSRQDREQYIKGIQIHTPPGLLGMLSSVPLCGEPAADDGTCPEASKIGTTRVASGAGSHPFEIEGNVYLTGPYGGNPFGLSVVVHVVAGPFNLGVNVVRARIAIDPEDSTLTVTTDETGPYAVPQIVFGVPVRLKRVTVNIDRPNFMFNPTNCGAQQVAAKISGAQETVASVSSPFAAGGCKSLAFKPAFAVSTNGRTSRKNGASLYAKLSYPKGSFGNDANVAYVKVSLPKQLPSRLTTLQKACAARTFEQNPATCPSGSIVGIARADTPLLPALAPRACCPKEPRTSVIGPVYFVSHGGEKFPSLIIVLQGDGVRVDLTGATFINKSGITSSTFKTVPDVPVNSFELYLPQGKNSALAANGNLCSTKSKLKMPTEFVGQNGATIKRSTKIAVTGCGVKRKIKAR